MIKTMIISAFPACGKSYLSENDSERFKDSDSSQFSWLDNGERNPNFVEDYFEHIKDNIGKYEYIFISSHQEIRDKLVQENIPFILFYPSYSNKKTWLQRFKDRGNKQSFIDMFDNKWINLIESCKLQKNCLHIELYIDEYISDYISYNN